MPCWYYDKKYLKNTPSFKVGVSPESEARYRREGARFIIDAGARMGLGYNTWATAAVFFHRFYLFHSFVEFPHFVTAVGCLYFAGKVEETPKQCKDLIDMAQQMLTKEQFDTFEHNREKQIATLERILLQTIKFDFIIKHPYAYLLKYAKLVKGEKAKVDKLVQMSWTFINDSLCTTLPLQWEPDVIAVAVMYLASRLAKFEINDWEGKLIGCKKKWFEFFVEDATIDLLEDVCHQMLDLYPKPQKSETTSPNSLTSTSNVESVQHLPKSDVSVLPPPKPQSHNGERIIKLNAQIEAANHISSTSFQQPASIFQSFSQTNAQVANGVNLSSFSNVAVPQPIQSDGQCNSFQYTKHVGPPQLAGQRFHVPATHTHQQTSTTFAGRLTITTVPPQHAPLPATTNFQSSSQGAGVTGSCSFQNH